MALTSLQNQPHKKPRRKWNPKWKRY